MSSPVVSTGVPVDVPAVTAPSRRRRRGKKVNWCQIVGACLLVLYGLSVYEGIRNMVFALRKEKERYHYPHVGNNLRHQYSHDDSAVDFTVLVSWV